MCSGFTCFHTILPEILRKTYFYDQREKVEKNNQFLIHYYHRVKVEKYRDFIHYYHRVKSIEKDMFMYYNITKKFILF